MEMASADDLDNALKSKESLNKRDDMAQNSSTILLINEKSASVIEQSPLRTQDG